MFYRSANPKLVSSAVASNYVVGESTSVVTGTASGVSGH